MVDSCLSRSADFCTPEPTRWPSGNRDASAEERIYPPSLGHGFTQYKRAGKGVYEKTAGKGPDIITDD